MNFIVVACKVWTVLCWVRSGSVAGCCEKGNEHSVFIQDRSVLGCLSNC